MIFYETNVTVRFRHGQPGIYTSEAEARKAFNAAKRRIKKRGFGRCELFRCEARTSLSKEEWLSLFLSDAPGSYNNDYHEETTVRDFIHIRECIGDFVLTGHEEAA